MIQRINILLIDPSDTFAEQLQAILFAESSIGSVQVARTMSEASIHLCSDHFDLIVSSIPFDERVDNLLQELKREIPSVQVIGLHDVSSRNKPLVVDHFIDLESVFEEVPNILSLIY